MDENENVQNSEQPVPEPQPEPAPAPQPEPAPAPQPEPAPAPQPQPAPAQPAQPAQPQYQQPAPQYQQPPMQPQYQQPYQQPYPQPPMQPQPAPVIPATPAEKEALFKTGGSFWMLIAAIVMTVSLLSNLIGNVISLSILKILLAVLDIVIVVGFWVTWAKCRKQTLTPSGIKMMKVPYTIQYAFSVVRFVFNLVIWFMTLNVLSLLFGVVSFVFSTICFASILKTLKMALTISKDQTAAGKKAGIFAAVVMIISAALTLASEIIGFVTLTALLEAVDIPILTKLIGGGSVIGLVGSIITFLSGISVALVLLQFAKRMKAALGNN